LYDVYLTRLQISIPVKGNYRIEIEILISNRVITIYVYIGHAGGRVRG